MKLQLLTAALIVGAIFSTNAQQVYGEDFFVDPGVGGFNLGTINGQNAYFDSIFAFTDESLGTPETTKSKVTVFPNPAQDSFTISADNNTGLETLNIFDINRRLVKAMSLNNIINPRIDIADLANGLYLLDIHSAIGVTKTKLIKN